MFVSEDTLLRGGTHFYCWTNIAIYLQTTEGAFFVLHIGARITSTGKYLYYKPSLNIFICKLQELGGLLHAAHNYGICVHNC